MAAKKVAIIGSGLVGQSWAMIFAGHGYNVCMYDIKAELLQKALVSIKTNLELYESNGYLRGTGNAVAQLKRISTSNSIEECLDDAEYVQESVFENLEVKKEVFKKLDDIVGEDVILASSTSCILPSLFTEDLVHRDQVIVAHPVNPPYLVPLVELIPSPWTKALIVERTRKMMDDIGQSPVVIKKEMPGFVLNRIQYAILNECWRLVKDDVISAADVDTVMKSGLGHRYAHIGPLETAHLNAEGLIEYCDKYGSGIQKVSNTFGPIPSWTAKDASSIAQEMAPLSELKEKREKRDKFLIQLAKLKRDFENE